MLYLAFPTSRWANAVGTAVAGGPPHRSVREELPHTALPSGNGDQDVISTRRRRTARENTRHARRWVRDEYALQIFPLGGPLSSAGSDTGVPALFAHFAGTMEPSDFPSAFMSALPPVEFSDRCWQLPSRPMGSPGSRAWSFHTCTRPSTPPCSPRTCQ